MKPSQSPPNPSRFGGTERYVATDDLKLAVNAALTLQRPLLIKGEPGTGKTMLAEEVAGALGYPLLQWHVKSTTKAHQAYMNTMPYRVCAIPSWVTNGYGTLPTTSARACCGRLSNPMCLPSY
ncbi:ATPase [Advenella kashmirensis WT001]|uniref:ATPase n=1 Tax=Advenella kashmirensis (strain DSM 17095 / LMG 22695 / WT001) TaxID=1036672 RepID=I3UEK7_ADVKW|nr:ATPase [Advenella kashmirensis WT001]